MQVHTLLGLLDRILKVKALFGLPKKTIFNNASLIIGIKGQERIFYDIHISDKDLGFFPSMIMIFPFSNHNGIDWIRLKRFLVLILIMPRQTIGRIGVQFGYSINLGDHLFSISLFACASFYIDNSAFKGDFRATKLSNLPGIFFDIHLFFHRQHKANLHNLIKPPQGFPIQKASVSHQFNNFTMIAQIFCCLFNQVLSKVALMPLYLNYLDSNRNL